MYGMSLECAHRHKDALFAYKEAAKMFSSETSGAVIGKEAACGRKNTSS